jgi:hypothetical protein
MEKQPIKIPAALIGEFMTNPRLKVEGGHNGTRVADLKIFQTVITETFNNPEFQQKLAKVLAKER